MSTTKYIYDGKFKGNILVLGRTECAKTSFVQKLTLLEKYGFGKNFLKWINVLLNNQESCVINGGFTTQYFKLERGTR